MTLPTLPSGGQTVYNFLMNVASQGQLYDIGFNNVLTPVTVVNNIFPGLGVAKVIGADYQVRLPFQDIATLTVSTALITGNSTVVTLNGIALAPVVFAVTNAATLAAIAAQIAAQPNIASAVSDGTANILIKASQGFPVTVSAVTTLGATQPTWSVVFSNDNVFYGIAIYIQNKMNLLGVGGFGSGGPAPYIPGDPISVLTRGRIWVTTETTVTSDSPVFWRIVPTVPNPLVGSFRGDADGGNAILLPNNIRWLVGASAGGLAVLDINQP